MENPLQENNSSDNNPTVPPSDNPLTDQALPTTPPQPDTPIIQTPPEAKTLAKSKKWLILTIIVVVTLSLGIAAFLVYQNYQFKQQIAQTQFTPTPTISSPTTTSGSTANWKTFRNPAYTFQFNYPATWTVEVPDKSLQTLTVKDQEGNPTINIFTGVNFTITGPQAPCHPPSCNSEIVKGMENDITVYYQENKGFAMLDTGNQTGISLTLIKAAPTTKRAFNQILSTFEFSE